jgi:hypothetical protein
MVRPHSTGLSISYVTMPVQCTAGEADFWIFFLYFQLLPVITEFGLAKELLDQSRKGVFLYFHVFLPGNEFLGPKKEKKSQNTVGSNIFSSANTSLRV